MRRSSPPHVWQSTPTGIEIASQKALAMTEVEQYPPTIPSTIL